MSQVHEVNCSLLIGSVALGGAGNVYSTPMDRLQESTEAHLAMSVRSLLEKKRTKSWIGYEGSFFSLNSPAFLTSDVQSWLIMRFYCVVKFQWIDWIIERKIWASRGRRISIWHRACMGWYQLLQKNPHEVKIGRGLLAVMLQWQWWSYSISYTRLGYEASPSQS